MARAGADRRRSSCGTSPCSSAVYGAGHGVLRPGVRRDRARGAARRGARRRPTRWTSSCGRWRCASPARRSAACSSSVARRVAPRSRSTRHRSPSRRSRCSLMARARRARAAADAAALGARATSREGLRYVRAPRVAVGHVRQRPRSPTCCSWARPRCCCRSSSRTTSRGSAADLGLVFAAGGIGSIGCALVMGQRGLPRRDDHLHVRRRGRWPRSRSPATGWPPPSGS